MSRLHFVDSVCEMGHLGVELRDQTFQSINAIENFDALRMRIVPDLERPTHGSYLQVKPRFVTKLVYSNKKLYNQRKRIDYTYQ